jgi:hypothetical protein
MSRNQIVVTPGWLEKEPAADRLGVGLRQLENRAAKNEIRKQRLTRQPNERAARVLYSIEDIDAIVAGKPNHHGEPAPEPKPKADPDRSGSGSGSALTPAAGAGDPLAQLAAQLARIGAAFPPAEAAKPWLTLQEAAAWSGLPAAWLLERARAGQIQAVNVGQGSREFWRFNRAGLAK